MAADKGRLLVLSINTTSGIGSPQFAELGAARSNSLSINNEQVDVTAKDTNGWREYLEGAGIQSAALSVSGVFKDTAAEEALRSAAFTNAIELYEFAYGNGDIVTGLFAVTSYERAGEYNGEVTFTASLESAGPLTFTAGV